MSIAEFALGFAGIIIGLGVADLLVSLHRLVRARARVTWDWLALSFAGLQMLLSVILWWYIYFWFRAHDGASFLEFLPNILLLCVSFLMMAAALPDEVPAEGLVLREAYMANRAQPWTLLAVWIALNLVIQSLENWRLREFRLTEAVVAAGLLLCLALAAAGARSTRPWVHVLAITIIALLIVAPMLAVRFV